MKSEIRTIRKKGMGTRCAAAFFMMLFLVAQLHVTAVCAAAALEGTVVEDTSGDGGADNAQQADGAVSDSAQDEATSSDSAQDGEVSADITQDEEVSADITQEEEVQADLYMDTSADDNVVIGQDDKPYLALGADLTDEQKNTVLSLMGISPDDIDSYHVVTVTNDEEHQYLDQYLDASTIGTRALSSVVIVKRESGSGINISTKNISYCTVGMYKNALATAGLEDADVIVAGPFPLSGTAALIGAMKAYADMESVEVDKASLDAAMNEIVVTGQLSDSIGDSGQSEEFIAYLKKSVLEQGLENTEGIKKAVEEASDKFDITLTDEEEEQVVSLLQKIGGLDLDVDSLLQQAGSIYDSLSHLDTDSGTLGSIGAFLKGIWDAVVGFFRNLF